jgi:peptidoglycan/LPS O-acetylase OafA/YrhL
MKPFPDVLRPPATSLDYLPQLDVVRATAVSLVMWHHWCGHPDHPFGPMGVWLFFVLSGFLITRILLNARRDTPQDNRTALLNFYIRRFLRIFPLYYFVLLLSWATSENFRRDWYWYAAYLQNFKMMAADDPVKVFGVHLWTLAVEEQFYVVCPLIVLFAPRRALLPVIGCAIALSIVLRGVLAGMGWTPFGVYVFTPDNFDTLGCGALLACFWVHRRDDVVALRRIALAAGLIALVATAFVRLPVLNAALMAAPTALIGLWFVSRAAEGFRGWIGYAMSFPPSVYLGRISYGIYVYHFFAPAALRPLFERYHIREGGVAFGLVCLVVTVAVASLSWFLLERPFLLLKNRIRVGQNGSPEAGMMTASPTAGGRNS